MSARNRNENNEPNEEEKKTLRTKRLLEVSEEHTMAIFSSLSLARSLFLTFMAHTQVIVIIRLYREKKMFNVSKLN